jgi:hypothetical protein
MPALYTDQLRKVAKRWVGQIGAGGVNDGTTQTIPLASVTNLPTDTAVTIVIDRVDANGTATPNLEETTTGVVSGTSLVNCLRGQEGTAQAHNAGAVVEVLWSAKIWADAVTWGLVEHGQDGTHAATIVKTTATQTLTNKRVTPRIVSATSYTTNTGTSLNCDTTDRFIVTAQAGDLKFNNPSGTPTDGQTLWLMVTGTGARALTYDTQFEASAGVALPTTTVTTARLDIGFVWRSDNSKWRCVASA